MKHGALIHEPEDDVAVVIADTAEGSRIQVATLEGKMILTLKASEAISLGHKIAMRDIPGGKEVLEYGRAIGKASRDIAQGAHVHIHNLKSIRWARP